MKQDFLFRDLFIPIIDNVTMHERTMTIKKDYKTFLYCLKRTECGENGYKIICDFPMADSEPDRFEKLLKNHISLVIKNQGVVDKQKIVDFYVDASSIRGKAILNKKLEKKDVLIEDLIK